MSKMNYPRRKVVDAHKGLFWSNYWTCKLSCGHIEVAYGRNNPAALQREPPKTVGCRQCWKEKRGLSK